MYENIIDKLAHLDQSQVLRFKDELTPEELNSLMEQLKNLDYSVLSAHTADEKRGKIEPIDALSIAEIEKNRDSFTKTGLDAIRSGKVGAVLLAGGQGSRLGFEKPKGMFNIGVERELYIFECLISNLLGVVKEAGAWVPLFIMTSLQNDSDTKNFFKEHNYFGYRKDYITFFVQEQLPTLDINGKLMLSDKHTVLTAPNGNGGWYYSLVKSGLLGHLKKNNIEWINVFAVDNVLQHIADPCFIGAVIESGKSSGSKVVSKAAPEERVGVMCLEDGKPSIIEYYEMSDDMLNAREDDGRLSYSYGVILNYLFRIDDLNRDFGVELPLHKAFKAVGCIDESGKVIEPSEPNAYKFETLVLDMVKLQESCLCYEVERCREFAPVKNKTGVDSVDTARELLRLNGIEL